MGGGTRTRRERVAVPSDTQRHEVPTVEQALPVEFGAEQRQVFCRLLKEQYPDGFELNEANLRLLRRNVPSGMARFVEEPIIRACTCRRADGLCLLPEMVLGTECLEDVQEKLRGCLERSGHGMCAVSYLQSEQPLRWLERPCDYGQFAVKYLVPGSSVWMLGVSLVLSLRPESEKPEVLAGVVRELREWLSSEEECELSALARQFPFLDNAAIGWLLSEKLPEAVQLEREPGKVSWRLLESFYLPDDFGEQLTTCVAELKAENGVVALQPMLGWLSERNGCGSFAEDYDLMDERVAKQVIEKSWCGGACAWRGMRFQTGEERRNGRATERMGRTNLVDEYSRRHPGVFHLEDFLRAATEEFGQKTNRADVVMQQVLKPHAVRLDQQQWIAPGEFRRLSNWSEAMRKRIEEALLEHLDGHRWLSVAELPESLYYGLPELTLEGRRIDWTDWLLASVLQHLGGRLVRYCDIGASGQVIQGVVLPVTANLGDGEWDVLDYVLQDFLASPGRHSAIDAFDYLKRKGLRDLLSSKLQRHLNELVEK